MTKESGIPVPLGRLRPLPSISFYVHLPFCSRKCDYCDFFSLPARPPAEVESCIDETVGQIDRFRTALGQPRIDTIYVGGGTPSSIGPGTLDRLLAAFGADRPEEFTVEANPESLSQAFLAGLSRAGVNRLSLGVQTFDQEQRRTIGRAGGADALMRALEIVATGWAGRWNADLIYGLPGQSIPSAESDLKQLLSFRPDHVSLYALSVEDGTPLAGRINRREVQGVDEGVQEDIREALDARLADSGLQRYEISNHCRPGRACRHNLAYWKLKPYAGCGPGAVSTLAFDDGRPARLRVPERLHGFSAGFEVEELSAADFAADYFIMGLRLVEGIDGEVFRSIFGLELSDLIGPSLARLDPGWFRETRGALALSGRGLSMLNAVLRSILDDIETYRPEIRLRWPASSMDYLDT